MASAGASYRLRVLPNRPSVRRAGNPHTSVATGGVGGMRALLCNAHLLRAASTAPLCSAGSITRGYGCGYRCFTAGSRRDVSFVSDYINDSSRLATRAHSLAGLHRCARVSCCTCRGRSRGASSRIALTTVPASSRQKLFRAQEHESYLPFMQQPAEIWLFAHRGL